MVHLFNKVYLEFDDKIEINFNRVVISEKYGSKMLEILDQVSYGQLIAFGKTYDEVVGENFLDFVTILKDFGETYDKKIIVYCDKESYKKFISQWFRLILPNLDFDGVKTLMDFTVYKERIVSNTQLSSVYSIDLNSLWDGLGDVKDSWESTRDIDRTEIKKLNLNYSYEFLLSTYFSGDDSYKDELKKTLHMFLRRWFKEVFIDSRQMVLLNLTNHKFLSALGIDPNTVDITQLDPLATIEQLESYTDNEIWKRDQNTYGDCVLDGLSDEKSTKLMNTFLNILENFEGVQMNQSDFEIKNYINVACAETITDEELNSLLNYVIENPFDTALVPKFDFQNVNFPLIQYFLSEKYKEKDLTKYKLL